MACIMVIGGCTQVPPLSHATNNLPFGPDISVQDVVARVKCELADALNRKMTQKDFAWLQTWTVKADLTLQANDSGGITPSATYIDPLHNAYFLGAGPSSVSFPSGAPGNTVGATAQSFNFGIGATYSGQVFRTETVSFTISLQELRDWREHGAGKNSPCQPVGSTDLQGNLDLAPWIESALEPVRTGELQPGIHPAPGSGAKAAAPAGGGRLVNDTDDVRYFVDYAKNSATDAMKTAQQANATARQARTSDVISRTVKRRVAAFALQASKAAILARRASDEAGDMIKNGEFTATASRDRALELATNAAENSEAANRYATAAKLLANPNDPIDSLSHALNFIVTAGVGISPNWALLHWKGPATLGNLASVSGIRTHTLNIAMGSPAAAPSTDINRLLNNQAIRQAVQGP
jgi:hypothetical protein